MLKGDVFNANNITFSWQAVTWANEYRVYEVTDNGRQLIYKGTALSYKVYNLTEDTHYYEMTAYSNRFGESAASDRLEEDIVYPVMQPPVATVNVLGPDSARISWTFAVYANGYNVYEIIDGQPVLLVKNLNNLSYLLSNLSYANHEYYVTSFSNSFGESEPSATVIAKLIVDTEPPVTTADVTADWTNQNQVVTLSATDNETGVADTYYSINDGTFTAGTSFAVTEPGVTKVSFYSVDKVGNTEAPQTVYVKIDKTAPVTKASDIPSWTNKPVTVELTASDEGSGVAKTLYSIDDSEYVEGTSFTVSGEGSHQVSFYSVDMAGNTESIQTVYIKADNTAPVTKASDIPAWSGQPVTVDLTATDGLSGVAKTLYAIDDSAYVEGNSLTVSEEGIHQVTFYSVDAAGNTESVNIAEVRIDKTAPVIKMDLSDTYLPGTSLSLTYSASDNLSGIADEKMVVQGPDETAGTVMANGSTFQISKPGLYTVTITVTDAAGLSTALQKRFEVFIPATIEVTPKVIKGNKGVFTVRVVLPTGYSTDNLDLNSATLNGVKALNDNQGYYNQAKLGQFKFERSMFDWTPSEVTVNFECYLDGSLVVGQTTVKVQK